MTKRARQTHVKKLPRNRRGRDWFVGDIQGELQLLQQLLSHVDFDPKADRLISVGDLVDRGPNSFGVLTLYAKSKWFHAVTGNHDAMCRFGLEGDWDASRCSMRNGGHWINFLTVEQRKMVLSTLQSLPVALELVLSDNRSCGAVHADIGPSYGWNDVHSVAPNAVAAVEQGLDLMTDMFWGRTRALYAVAATYLPLKDVSELTRYGAMPYFNPTIGRDLIIAGHTSSIHHEPVAMANWLYIDTGAGRDDGRLTLADPVSGEVVQAAHGQPIVRGVLPQPVDTSGWALNPEQLAEAEAEAKRRSAIRDEAFRHFL